MVKELGYVPHFFGARRSDYAAMFHISLYMTMMQWSVVLADKVDTTVLGYALPDAHSESLLTVYQNVSKPFLQIRQTGWALTYMVMPAVAIAFGVGVALNIVPKRFIVGTATLAAVTLVRPVLLSLGVLKAFEMCCSSKPQQKKSSPPSNAPPLL